MRGPMWACGGLALVAAIVCAGSVWLGYRSVPRAATLHLADADDKTLVAAGRPIYMRYCASCHGRRLEGQPLWQLDVDGDGRRRAPAHDDSGHTWRHSDEAIFRMVKFGRFTDTPPEAVSYMPAFGPVLDDADILKAIAFIKARWSVGLRASQSMLNPGFFGMPASAKDANWTLPPTCTATQQRWRAVSK